MILALFVFQVNTDLDINSDIININFIKYQWVQNDYGITSWNSFLVNIKKLVIIL